MRSLFGCRFSDTCTWSGGSATLPRQVMSVFIGKIRAGLGLGFGTRTAELCPDQLYLSQPAAHPMPTDSIISCLGSMCPPIRRSRR